MCNFVSHFTPNLAEHGNKCAYGPPSMTTLLRQPKLNYKRSDVEVLWCEDAVCVTSGRQWHRPWWYPGAKWSTCGFYKLNTRDLKIHVYRERLTARNHVIRARRHVWGFELAFWTSRGGFSRKSFTSSFIALNFILCHVQILKSKVTLFLQIE